MPLTRGQHFDSAFSPKRILALDGGGLRGILTLEYLSAMETLLARRLGRADFRLCDYFDLIGGTSTGSIIAAGLACGMSVNDLQERYKNIGVQVFVPKLVPQRASRAQVSDGESAEGDRRSSRRGCDTR